MGELSKLRNIGKVVEEQLNEVGINTVDELIDIGSKDRCNSAYNLSFFLDGIYLKSYLFISVV